MTPVVVKALRVRFAVALVIAVAGAVLCSRTYQFAVLVGIVTGFLFALLLTVDL
jgi:hypothetical protein